MRPSHGCVCVSKPSDSVRGRRGAGECERGRRSAVALDGVDSPPEPPAGYAAVGRHVNATATGEDSTLFLNASYDESELGEVDEDTLQMWEYEGGNWTRVEGTNNVNAG